MNQRHKHADVIHAWAEGEEIEVRRGTEWLTWDRPDAPSFNEMNQYRVKPKTVKKEGWVNVYSTSTACISPTKEVADRHACPQRKACIRIEWEEEV